MAIEDDGPSETFKDEESKVSQSKQKMQTHTNELLQISKDFVSLSRIEMSCTLDWLFFFRSLNTYTNGITQCNTPVDEVDKPSKEEIFKKRLQKELVSRDGHGYAWVLISLILFVVTTVG